MAKYNTPYKYVLEGIQDAIDMGYLSEDRKTWWLQCSWHINGEDIICFFEVLQMLKIDVFRRMGARPVVIEYTEGEEENNIEEIGFDGGYKISSEKFPPIYIGWCAGTGAPAKELTPVTKLAIKNSTLPFIENKSKKAKKEARVSNFDLSPYDLRNQIKSYVRGRLYDLVGPDGARNFKINQPKWDMIYDGAQGGTSFAIRTQGEDYYMSTFINSSIDWQGKGFEEFKEDFEDMVQECFKQM